MIGCTFDIGLNVHEKKVIIQSISPSLKHALIGRNWWGFPQNFHKLFVLQTKQASNSNFKGGTFFPGFGALRTRCSSEDIFMSF